MPEDDERLPVLKAAREEAEEALQSLDNSWEILKKDYIMDFASEYITARESLKTIILRTQEIYNRIEAKEE